MVTGYLNLPINVCGPEKTCRWICGTEEKGGIWKPNFGVGLEGTSVRAKAAIESTKIFVVSFYSDEVSLCFGLQRTQRQMLVGKLSNGRCYVRSRDNEEVCDGSGRAIMESDQLLILHGEKWEGKNKSSAKH